jgi:hypothetical protein
MAGQHRPEFGTPRAKTSRDYKPTHGKAKKGTGIPAGVQGIPLGSRGGAAPKYTGKGTSSGGGILSKIFRKG